MNNHRQQIAFLQAQRILYLFALAYCTKALRANERTGESGWMLSGMIAGGSTVDAQWLNNLYLQQTLSTPYAGAVNHDPLAGVRLYKIPATDKQDPKTVGTELLTPFAAAVLDGKNLPVVGATVTFRIIAGGGTIQCLNEAGAPAGPPSEASCDATTSNAGIAKATLTLGFKTDANADYMKLDQSDEFYTRVGLNLVTAAVAAYSGAIPAVGPFEAYGKPDVPAQMNKVLGEGNGAVVNNPAGSLSVVVADKHGNPVSNINVKFTSGQATSLNPTAVFPTESQGLLKLVFYKRSECSVSYPLRGDCPNYNTVLIKTDSYGALIDTIVGNTVETQYTVEAAVQNLPSGSPAVAPATFTLYSYGHRNGDGYIPTYLSLESLFLVNDKGQPINASKAGTPLKAPLAARLIKISEPLIMQQQSMCGDNTPEPCWRTTSNGVTSLVTVTNGNISFTAKPGEGTAGQTSHVGNGKYQAQYTTGNQPKKNTVDVSGTAYLIELPQVLSSGGAAIEYNYHTDHLTMRETNVPTGTYATFDVATMELKSYKTDPNPIYKVYGVDARLTVAPNYVMVDKNGYTKADTTLTYTILPDGTGSTEPDAAYRANNVDIDFYTNNGTSTGDTWSGYVIGDSLQGLGTNVLTMGSYFDINVQNKAQVVLNRGGDAEVQSDKIPVKAALFLITKPTTTEKILIKNDTDGTPKMPELPLNLVLKGVDIPNSLLDDKQICWNLKVEYIVNITKKNAEHRSRKGLNCNDQGVCTGTDGFILVDANGPTQNNCINRVGPILSMTSANINDNTHASWGSDFGGGTFTISAKAVIDNTEVSDTYLGAIQGQKNGSNADDSLVDTKFKEYICKYLEAPSGVVNYQAEILDVLGHNKVFRILAYHESAHTYDHFERLSDGNWKKLGPVLGYSSDYVFPLLNKYGTWGNPSSDGGFGLMQLTDPAPSYLQIWNWKINIDGGVNLIKDKIRISKYLLKNLSGGQLPGVDSIGKSILRMETYYQYGRHKPGIKTYWLWDDRDGWVFSTQDQLYSDEVREVEDTVDAAQYDATQYSLIPGWKYSGE